MKKILAFILAAVFVLSAFAGCGNKAETAPAPGAAEAPAATEGAAPAEVVKIVVAFPTWSGAPADLKEIEAAMNEISVAKIGVEATLLVTDFGSYKQQMTLMMSGDEQLDVISNLGAGYSTNVMNGFYIDMEENGLFETYGQGIVEAVGMDYINACRVGGVLYGLPNNRDMAVGKGCYSIRTDLLTSVGYVPTGAEIETGTLEEIYALFALLHEAYPDMEVFRPVTGSLNQLRPYDFLGGDNFGVLLDGGNSLEVVNLFESEEYLAYCQQMRDWYTAGYISVDAATDTTGVGDLVKAGTLIAYNTGGKPGIKAQESALCGYDMTIIQTEPDYMASNAVASFPWSIPLNTVDAVAAMKWLNLLYTDADMMNLICWGIEGKHYVQKDDGFLTYPEGVDASTSGYNHAMNWMFPNQYILKVWEGNAATLWPDTQAFNNNSVHSKALGFSFDPANVMTEYTACTNVYNEYQKSLEFGLVDPAEGIAEMNAKMEAAGLDVIIAEKIAQLEAWAAANGVS